MRAITQDTRYSVTADGRVWSHPKERSSRTGRWLSVRPDILGYPVISMKGRTYRVHRLVAEAYLPNPDNKSQVNHKNGNKADNRVENLEWATPRENLMHAIETGLARRALGEENGKSKLTSSQVAEIKTLLLTGTASGIARQFSISRGAIRSIKDGKTWRHI